jgi:hypothetical protein
MGRGWAGKLESKELQSFVVSGFPKFVTRVNTDSVQAFLAVQPTRPKVSHTPPSPCSPEPSLSSFLTLRTACGK